MTNEEKTRNLLSLLDELKSASFAKEDQKIDFWVQQLQIIYADDYRHNYADLFYHLQQALVGEPDVLECIGENLNVLEVHIRALGETIEGKHTSECFKKYADHIRLEIGRYNFIRQNYVPISAEKGSAPQCSPEDCQFSTDLENKMRGLQSTVDKIRPIATQAQKALDGLDAKLESNKISSITTLTIFSAVVLAFSGGITFEAGMLQGMANASPYRLVFTIALTGFILFNTLFVLLYLVGKLSGKAIGTRCRFMQTGDNAKTECKKCGDGYCTKPYNSGSVACRIIHKYTYVFAVNAVLLYTLYSDYILWFFQPTQITFDILVYLLVPIVLSFIGLILNKLFRRSQRKRILFACKVRLVGQVLGAKESANSWFYSIASVLGKLVGNNHKAIAERYKDEVCSDYEDGPIRFRLLLRKTNTFVMDNMLSVDEMACTISPEQHWHNKRVWKRYKKQLREYLKDLSETKSE